MAAGEDAFLVRNHNLSILINYGIHKSSTFNAQATVIGEPAGGRRALRRHRAQRQTALRKLQETLRKVIQYRLQTQVVEVERPPQLLKKNMSSQFVTT